jgi:hypothetical protein
LRNTVPRNAIAIAIFLLFMASVALGQQENTQQKNSADVAKAVVDDASKTATAAAPTQPIGPAEPKTETKGSTLPAPSTGPDGWHFEMTPRLVSRT